MGLLSVPAMLKISVILFTVGDMYMDVKKAQFILFYIYIVTYWPGNYKTCYTQVIYWN